MRTKYTHLELGKEVEVGIAGYYVPHKEVRLKHNGRDILYVIGKAVIESSCCGSGNWIYAIIPGYVVEWQGGKNADGLAVSEVEPISEKDVQEEVRATLETAEDAVMVGFW